MFGALKTIIYFATFCISWAAYAIEVPEQVEDSFVKTKTTYFDQKTKKQVDIYGSGTIINHNGESFVITASHVVGGKDTRFILQDGQVISNFTPIEVDNYWDYAILKLNKFYRSTVNFNEDSVEFIVSPAPKHKCIIPNLYALENSEKMLSLDSKDITQSSTFYEKVLKSVAIKPRMSGSALICNGKFVGILKAFNRIHDISYATESYLVTNHLMRKKIPAQIKSSYFIKAKWYLYNSELLREYSSSSKSKYTETPNTLNTSYRKNAGGGVRSDGGGSDDRVILDSKIAEKKMDLHLENYGFLTKNRNQIFSFKAKPEYDEVIYFLANESSLSYIQGFDHGFSMYDSFDSSEEIGKSVDLLRIAKERIVKYRSQSNLELLPVGECHVSFENNRVIKVNIEFKKIKINFDLPVAEAGNSDKQLVYKYDMLTKTGIDMLGLFFTDLGLIMEKDLMVTQDVGEGSKDIISNYNLSYIVLKQESSKSVILPCFTN